MDHAAICRHIKFSNDYNKKIQELPADDGFYKRQHSKILYGSNSQEGTLPKNRNDDTLIMVQRSLQEL